jgi:OmcA/MtrC family decaheme c-type cytochrome
MPEETVTFKTMIHRIHTREDLKTEYTIYGYGGIAKDETEKLYPGDRRNCGKCHVNSSEQLPLPEGLLDVVNPRGKVNPTGPVAAACMGCHTGAALASHVIAMTTRLGRKLRGLPWEERVVLGGSGTRALE